MTDLESIILPDYVELPVMRVIQPSEEDLARIDGGDVYQGS